MAPPPDVLVPSQGGDSVGTAGAARRVSARPGASRRRGGHAVRRSVGYPSHPGAEHDRETTGPITGARPGHRGGAGGPGHRRRAAAARAAAPRRARLHIKRIDPWSMMKFSFAVSLVLFFVAVVATSVLYLALDAMGVFDEVNKALAELVGNAGGTTGGGFKITAKGVVGGSALLGAVNVVLFTALATLGAFIYNVCADLVGGIELTLAEKD